VLGGGFVAGSTTLLYGEPGVGKSTLALMALRALALAGADAVLVASEESAAQVAQRARRFGEVPDGLEVATSTNVHSAEALLRERRRTLCVVDSISAMSDDTLTSAVVRSRRYENAAERLCAAAKATGTALLLIGHVTRTASSPDSRPRTPGRHRGSHRGGASRNASAPSCAEAPFRPTGEVGLFEMVGDGLRELTDASLSLRGPQLDVAGVVLTVTNDGSRSFLVEIQALVAHASGSTRRVAYQVSSQRLSLLLAVLESRCGVDTSALDVFAATAAARRERARRGRALALAVASAVLGFAVPPTLVALGEVGLAGELRAVSGLTRRVREASRLGATWSSSRRGRTRGRAGVTVIRCHSLVEAIDAAPPDRGR